MTDSLLLVVSVFLCLLVGATLPVLYQLYQTLKRARLLLETTGPHLDRTLDQMGQAADRLDRIGSSLEGPVQALKPALAAASVVGFTLGRSGRWLRIASSIAGALAPAVIAAGSALFSRADTRRRSDEHREDQKHAG